MKKRRIMEPHSASGEVVCPHMTPSSFNFRGGVDPHVEKFERDFPGAQPVLRLLKEADASPVWLAPVKAGAPAHSWQLHVRLPRYLEEHFGFTRQILLYCLCADDVHPRDGRRIQTLIRGASDPIASDFAIVVAKDQRVVEKLHDWAIERELGMVIVPLSIDQVEEELNSEEHTPTLQRLIGGWLSSHDLYDDRLPVTGDNFFGRGRVLRDLDRKLAQNRGHTGIYGLRRIGKTSLALELKERLAKRTDLYPVFIDLAAATGGAPHAAHRVLTEVADLLTERSDLSKRQALQALRVAEAWEDIDPKVMMSRLADGVPGVLTDGALSGCHIVLILDEAEALLSAQSGLADEHVLGFFRAIKGIAQETRQLSLVLVGVNAAPSEEATLAGEDNPLFGLLSPEYLGPLEAGECDEMIRRIGRRMQVRWDGPGVSRLTEKVGAHPLLARLAASDVVGSGDERLRRPTVEAVEKVFIDFHQRHTDIFEQMFYSLKRYYPSELYLLEIVASGEIGIAAELAEESPMMLNHLAGYGVLDPEHLTIAMPVLRLWLRQRQGSLGP